MSNIGHPQGMVGGCDEQYWSPQERLGGREERLGDRQERLGGREERLGGRQGRPGVAFLRIGSHTWDFLRPFSGLVRYFFSLVF